MGDVIQDVVAGKPVAVIFYLRSTQRCRQRGGWLRIPITEVHEPRSQTNRRIGDYVERWGTRRHLERVVDAFGEQALELLKLRMLISRQVWRSRAAGGDRPGNLRWHSPRHIGMNAD